MKSFIPPDQLILLMPLKPPFNLLYLFLADQQAPIFYRVLPKNVEAGMMIGFSGTINLLP
jgi:hypothetical protein